MRRPSISMYWLVPIRSFNFFLAEKLQSQLNLASLVTEKGARVWREGPDAKDVDQLTRRLPAIEIDFINGLDITHFVERTSLALRNTLCASGTKEGPALSKKSHRCLFRLPVKGQAGIDRLYFNFLISPVSMPSSS